MNLKKFYTRPEFWVGVIIICAGIYYHLDKAGLSTLQTVRTGWPLLLSFAGIFQLFSRQYRDVGASALLIAAGGGLFLYNLGYLTMESVNTEWPSVLREIVNTVLKLFQTVWTILETRTGVLS